MNALLNLFHDKDGNLRLFIRQEDELTHLFTDTESLRSEYTNQQRVRDNLQNQLNEFNQENSEIPNKSFLNSESSRDLKWRKWATVAADALLSFAAVKLFFIETINVDLPFLPALVLGVCVAYLLLRLAISYKYYDNQMVNGNHLITIWTKYSYVVPLLIIPFLSFYLIIQNPNNPANIIWVFFLGFCFLLNLKAASYSNEYVEMNLTKAKQKEQKRIQDKISAKDKSIDKLQRNVQELANKIMRKATEFRRNYEAFPEDLRPRLNLHLPYRFILNTRVYYHNVLPIPQIVISNPPPDGGINIFCQWWDEATNTPGSFDRQNTIEQPEQISEIGQNNFTEENSNAEQPFNTQDDLVQNDPWDNNESFGKTVSDNEKFI